VIAHLADFEASLQAKGCSEGHVSILVGRLRKLFDGCRITTLGDATAAAVEEQSIVTQDMSVNMQRASAELS